jgi:ribosomal protein L37AE/L43A
MNDERKWSYCTKCMHNQYFVLKESIYVCEECGKTLQFALVRGTIVTPNKEVLWQQK